MNNKDSQDFLFAIFMIIILVNTKMYLQIKTLEKQISNLTEYSCECQQKQPEQPRNLHLALQ